MTMALHSVPKNLELQESWENLKSPSFVYFTMTQHVGKWIKNKIFGQPFFYLSSTKTDIKINFLVVVTFYMILATNLAYHRMIYWQQLNCKNRQDGHQTEYYCENDIYQNLHHQISQESEFFWSFKNWRQAFVDLILPSTILVILR